MRFCGSADGGLRGGLLLVYCFAADRFLVAMACFAVSAVVWVWQFPCVRPWGGIWGGSGSCGVGHHGGILIFRGLVTSIGGVFVLGWGLGGRL